MNDARHIPINIRTSVPSPWKVHVPSRIEGYVQSVSLRKVEPALPLWMIMFRSRSATLRVTALFLIIALNATGLSQVGLTTSYFFDEETSTGNTFVAGIIDFTLVNGSFVPTSTMLNLTAGTSTAKYIDVVMNPLSNPMQYYASSSQLTGDALFCNDLDATMMIGTSTLYDGRLSTLLSATTTATTSPWNMRISLPATSTAINSMCEWNTDYNGWQTRHDYPNYPNAFNDTETVTHKVYSSGLRINKVYYDVDESENVTPAICDGLSPGYWATHDGCNNGSGNTDWKPVVSAISSGFSGVFVSTSANQMCKALTTSLCPAANTTAGKKCRAKRQLLANEMNVASWHLSLDAIIAGADNGDPAFDTLGLTSTSSIRQAILIAEQIVANPASTGAQFVAVTTVMDRIHIFYESENTEAPYCQYLPGQHSTRGIEPANEWVELYNQTNQPINVNGWSLCDDAVCESLFTAGTSTIPPQGYAVVTGASSTWNFWNVPTDIVQIVIPDGTVGNGLDNDADMLLLKRPSDQLVIDQMNYGVPDGLWANANADLWNPGVNVAPEGQMLGRKPTGYDTNQPSDWVTYAPPHAQLIYPTSTESGTAWLDWGQNIDITWIATNPNGLDSALMIDLFYIEDIDFSTSITTSDRVTTIATSTANDGLFNWTVPSGFTGWVWVELLARGPENPMIRTSVTSGRIWDPPKPLYELWGVEQESQPMDEEYAPEDLLPDDEVPIEAVVIEEVATSSATTTEETVTDTASSTPLVEETAGGLPPSGDNAGGVPPVEVPETATTTEETSSETASSTEPTASSTPEGVNEEGTPNEDGTTTDETVPEEPAVETTTQEEVPAPAESEELPPPPPVDTEAREEDVSGGVTTPEVPPPSDPVPPPPAPEPAPVAPVE